MPLGSVLLLPTILSWFVLSNYGVCYAYEGFFLFSIVRLRPIWFPCLCNRVVLLFVLFGAAAADEKHDFSKYAEDYTLFELGEFDEATGQFSLHNTPVSLGKASELKATTRT